MGFVYSGSRICLGPRLWHTEPAARRIEGSYCVPFQELVSGVLAHPVEHLEAHR